MAQTFRAMLADSNGQGLLEYAVIIAMVAIACIAALQLLSNRAIETLLNPAANTIPG